MRPGFLSGDGVLEIQRGRKEGRENRIITFGYLWERSNEKAWEGKMSQNQGPTESQKEKERRDARSNQRSQLCDYSGSRDLKQVQLQFLTCACQASP